MKKLDKLDKYVTLPNVGFYGGFIYDGEDIDLCHDHDVDKDYDFKVDQQIKNGILLTDYIKEYMVKDKKVSETVHLELEMEKGMLLIYEEGYGFVVPETPLTTVDNAIGQYKILKGEMPNDIKRDEG